MPTARTSTKTHLQSRTKRVGRRFARFAALVTFGYLLIPITHLSATTLPDGFGEIQYATGLTDPTAMAFAPDPCPSSGAPVHRLFVCEKEGTVRVFRNGVLQSQPFLSVTTDSCGERGLDGICFDPDFVTNHYVYVYYTVPATSTAPAHNRLSRFTADPAHPDVAIAGSETRIMEMDDLGGACIHNGSGLHFGLDGKLYISVGENGNGANSQSLNTVLGKILRIDPVPENADGTNPDSTFPTDNPFYNSTTGKNRAIYILGLRNPFTFNFQPGTGRMFIDDVGSAYWEEINDGVSGGNYGWPTIEGPSSPPDYDLDNTDPRVPGFIYPLLGYSHYGGVTPSGCAITGGTFYNPPSACSGDPPFGFPASYVGQYFFMDFCSGWIYTMDPNLVDPSSPFGWRQIAPFASGIHGSPTYLSVGPDKNLYYISRDDGAVYQIRYPASLAPSIGTQPADVLVGQGWPATFSVAASGVPPLHYRWQRNDVDIAGAADASSYTLENPTVTNDDGATFRCIVSNSYGSTTTREALLSVTTKQPPVCTIEYPPAGTYYNGGDTITFVGSAVDGHDIVTGDPQDGVLGPSAFTWQVLFEHHPLTDPNHHTHPFYPPTSGIANGTFTIPISGETDPDVWYRIFFTATDSYGLSTTIYRDIFPHHAQLSVTTSPVLLTVTVDSSPRNAPYSFWGVFNMMRSLGVATTQVLNGLTYDFYSWSDGGALAHTIMVPTTATTYVANFWKRAAYGTITANPNPVQLTGTSNSGTTTVYWSSSNASSVEIHRDSPSGPLFVASGPGQFSQATGNWVNEGTKLFLQDVSNGQPLTAEFTLDSVTLHVTSTLVGSITADPNPFIPDSQGLGQTTLAWTSTHQVEVHIDAPNGALFASSGAGSFSATTGDWVSNGTTFYLQNVSNGLPLTAANTLATVSMTAVTLGATGSITALPNPISLDTNGLGRTTLGWTSYGTSQVEIHVDAPDGPGFAGSGPGSFAAGTGQWVDNGMTFYLQNVSNGLPLTSANTLAIVTVTAAPTPPASGSISAWPNPFTPDENGLGHTTLAWTSVGTTSVEVHLGAPDGTLFAGSGVGSFAVPTGQWVTNGMTFYLQNVSNGLPLTQANTLATVRMTAAP